MKRIILGAVTALALLAALPRAALAQSAAPTARQADLARQIIDATGVRTTYANQMRALFVQLADQMIGAGDVKEKEVVEKALVAVLPQLIDRVTDVYAQVYSEQELVDILAFYKSPGGQAMIAKQPEILTKSMQAGASMGPQLQAAFVQALNDSKP